MGRIRHRGPPVRNNAEETKSAIETFLIVGSNPAMRTNKIRNDMGWYWIVLIIVLLAVACYHVYVSAEHHELHKMRAAFEKVEMNILDKLEYERNTLSKDGVTFGQLPKETVQGAGYAVQKMLEMLNNEEGKIDHELINFCKKTLTDIFHGKE